MVDLEKKEENEYIGVHQTPSTSTTLKLSDFEFIDGSPYGKCCFCGVFADRIWGANIPLRKAICYKCVSLLSTSEQPRNTK